MYFPLLFSVQIFNIRVLHSKLSTAPYKPVNNYLVLMTLKGQRKVAWGKFRNKKKPDTLVSGFRVVGDDGLATLSRFGGPDNLKTVLLRRGLLFSFQVL